MTDDKSSRLPLPLGEFIALLAWLMAMTALSIDIMLPALPAIAKTYAVANENDRQLIVASYLMGMAGGQLVWGHISDRLGRRIPLLAGLAVYTISAVAALLSPTFQSLIFARVIQGFGGAAARTLGTAIVRDVFAGREMARTMSFVMMVFIMVPVLAPSIGQLLLAYGDWRWCFMALVLSGLIAMLWVTIRLPETSKSKVSGVQSTTSFWRSVRTVLGNPVTHSYGLAAGLTFGCLVTYISSAQQIFVDIYGLGHLFPLAFGGIAVSMAVAAFTNSQLVLRLGMRRLSHLALVAFVIVSITLALICLAGTPPLSVTLICLGLSFYLFAIIQSNFNAIAMHPIGHVAGMGASLLGAFVTFCGVVLGGAIARSFDGTLLPLAVGFALLGSCALVVILLHEGPRGMFRGE
ncbi:MAG: multidrug effflux MFS transporter [Hyphomicrobiaceae bacterium]